MRGQLCVNRKEKNREVISKSIQGRKKMITVEIQEKIRRLHVVDLS